MLYHFVKIAIEMSQFIDFMVLNKVPQRTICFIHCRRSKGEDRIEEQKRCSVHEQPKKSQRNGNFMIMACLGYTQRSS